MHSAISKREKRKIREKRKPFAGAQLPSANAYILHIGAKVPS